MTDAQRAVLEALSCVYDDYDGGGYAHFAYVMERTGFPRAVVRRICRHLARNGLAEYSCGLWSKDGEPAGAGYGITKAGLAVLEANDVTTSLDFSGGGYRFKDLLAAGIVSSRGDLNYKQTRLGFPRPIKIGLSAAWFPKSEVHGWLAQRAALRDHTTTSASHD